METAKRPIPTDGGQQESGHRAPEGSKDLGRKKLWGRQNQKA